MNICKHRGGAIMKTETWGAELEFWAFDKIEKKQFDPETDFRHDDGTFLRTTNLWDILEGKHHKDKNGSDIFLDAGINQGEIGILPICVADEKDLMQVSSRCLEATKEVKRLCGIGTFLYFQGKNPMRRPKCLAPVNSIPFNQKAVNTTYLEAIMKEGGINQEGSYWMTEYSSLQFHLEVGKLTEKSYRLLYWLNMFCPPIGWAFSNSNRIKEAWWGSGLSRRQPHYFDYELDDYVNMLKGVPKLLSYENETFYPYNKPPENPLDTLHIACLSHFVKYRPDFGTVEIRILDAVPPAEIFEILIKIRKVVHKIQSSSDEKLQDHFINKHLWWQWILTGSKSSGQKWIKNFLR